MAIKDELNELFKIMLEHPDELEKLKFYLKLKNGTKVKYMVNRKKEERLKAKEEKRRIALEDKRRKQEERAARKKDKS